MQMGPFAYTPVLETGPRQAGTHMRMRNSALRAGGNLVG